MVCDNDVVSWDWCCVDLGCLLYVICYVGCEEVVELYGMRLVWFCWVFFILCYCML